MNGLRARMTQDLELAGCAERTRSIYLHSIMDFAEHGGRSPADASQDDVRAWVQHLSKRNLSALLEAGTDIRVIQVVLGHRSIRTKARYAHVSPEIISKIPSPFDRLDLRVAE